MVKAHFGNGRTNTKANVISFELEIAKYNLYTLLVSCVDRENRSVITEWDELEEMLDKSYGVENAIFVMDGNYITGERICVFDTSSTNNFEFKNWRNKRIVMVGGCAHLVGKRTKFQLIWDGVRKEII